MLCSGPHPQVKVFGSSAISLVPNIHTHQLPEVIASSSMLKGNKAVSANLWDHTMNIV